MGPVAVFVGKAMRNEAIFQRMQLALNKLAKWRSVLTGWQLGTRAMSDPECQAIRDHRELSLILRAEVTALTRVLVEKRLCTEDDINLALTKEAANLDRAMEERFPGFKSTQQGMVMTLKAAETMKGWKP